MDNLTHSLIGAVLGQTGLKRRTGLAIPALIIGANLPDIDAGCSIYGIESLAMRRGITHGPIAMLVLPLLLAGALWWFDRWQARRGKRPEERLPIRFGWLLALSFIGCLTHPAFDWLNNYGIRLLEPFSSQWFYGDTLFIVDPWLWVILGAGLWLSLRLERKASRASCVIAMAVFGVAIVYIGGNLLISARAELLVRAELQRRSPYFADDPHLLVVANPVPLEFWRREVLWRARDRHYGVDFSLWDDKVHLGYQPIPADPAPAIVRSEPANMDDPRVAELARGNPTAEAFLFWSRMPVVVREGEEAALLDQRYMDRAGPSFRVELGKEP